MIIICLASLCLSQNMRINAMIQIIRDNNNINMYSNPAEAAAAKEKMMQEKLQREKLAGDKDVAHSNFESESAAYKLVITPYEREIYVITMIKIKINEHCDRLAKGEESTFGQ